MQERFQEFTVLIANINRSIYKIKAEEMSEFNLKSSHVSCIYYIYRENALTAKNICDLSGADKANVSRALKYLEENGYIESAPSQKKKYQCELKLTPKGEEVGNFLSKKIDSVLDFASSGISDEDRKTMYTCLNLINKNLDKLRGGVDFLPATKGEQND